VRSGSFAAVDVFGKGGKDMAKLEKGAKAPAFRLRDQDGKWVKLSDFRKQKILVYFYPRANTPGCTIQACAVRDALADLGKVGVAAIGISPDAPEAQGKFDAKHGLGFPLLSDEDHAVAEAFGVWGEKNMYGKKRMGIIRSAFLIDEKGRIQEAWYKVSPKDTVPNVMATV
jgi:peroxiredoxin Q/BCP